MGSALQSNLENNPGTLVGPGPHKKPLVTQVTLQVVVPPGFAPIHQNQNHADVIQLPSVRQPFFLPMAHRNCFCFFPL